MSDTVIRVERLGKRYQLGQRDAYKTLRDSLGGAIAAPLRRLATFRWQSDDNGIVSTNGQRDSIWALRDVTFEVNRGEIVGIIGRNGAGKSTLLKILSRITYPTEGKVRLQGRLGSLLEVGTGFHPELTGRENIYLSGTVLGLKLAEIKRKFDDIVEFAAITEFLDTPVKRYSSGMYVRLAFAVAAHLEPDILIVDEVLAVGDAEFQRKCLGKMGDVARSGRTVLFVSHNMNAIQRLCSRSMLLEQGRLVASGDTREIVGRYLAAGILSTPPDTWIDMSDVRRSGSGGVRVEALRYGSGNPVLRSHAHPGGPLQVTLRVSSDARRSVTDVAVTLYDQNGVKLVNVDTSSLGQATEVDRGITFIRFCIPTLNLNPGSYVLGWWLANQPNQVLDYCESAMALEVMDVQRREFGIRPSSDGVVVSDFSVDVTRHADVRERACMG